MPKSKRNKTQKQGHVRKEKLIEEIRECLDSYKHIFVFSTANMRNVKLKEVRTKFQGSRFFFGKNKVMAIALGRTPQEEIKEKLSKVANNLTGSCGIFFTNEDAKDVKKFFLEYREGDYARSGFEATKTIVIPVGPIKELAESEDSVSFPPSSLDLLTKLGLKQARLINGVIEMKIEHVLCKEGDILTPEQCKLLVCFLFI